MKGKILNLFKKILLREYWFIDKVLLIVFGTYLIIEKFLFSYYPNKGDRFYELEVQAFITFIVTFVGISIPILYNLESEKRKDKRILGFTLGLTWNELRFNKYILDSINGNFNLGEMLNDIENFIELINIITIKTEGLKKMSDFFQKISFEGSQNSGAITKYNIDDDFNTVTKAYDDITAIQLQFSVLHSDLLAKKLTTKTHLTELQPQNITEIKEYLRQRADYLKNQIDVTIQSVNEAIKLLNLRLDSMNIKAEEVPIPTLN
ncbi:hypothetical protein CANDROIZ_470008 [Candidatus Roizmanbacteria bacterium]|nr:hypothetical protein CANDROIZ_470008 [Candidatus Roizmanbacteria bacterium]